MKNASHFLSMLLALFAFSLPAFGQHDFELNGGYQHISGDQGLDGFTAGAAFNMAPRFQLFVSYDGVFDHSTLGSLALTNVGLTFVNSHLTNVLTGPRAFLPGLLKGHGDIKGHHLHPFFEALFGESRLHTQVTEVSIGQVSAADTAFTWGFGGGVDFRVAPHFTVRPNLDFLRTHFVESGQSRVRLGVAVVWSHSSRAGE